MNNGYDTLDMECCGLDMKAYAGLEREWEIYMHVQPASLTRVLYNLTRNGIPRK